MTTTRTYSTFRIDTWTPDGESIVEHVAGIIPGPHDQPLAPSSGGALLAVPGERLKREKAPPGLTGLKG
jgi:hypothetical protein